MKFIIEKAKWLESREKTWDKSFSDIILPFHEKLDALIEELKDKFNDKDDPIKVHEVYLEYLKDAFDELRETVKQSNDKDDLNKLWDELSMNLVFWKEEFKKMYETLDNYTSIFRLGYEIFNIITTYNTNKIKKEYLDLLKGELDDIRENISNFIKEVKVDINNRIVDLNSEDIFAMTNLDEKEVEDYTLNQGDEVRYFMSNDEENIAIISHNQEDLKEDDNIRLVSKNDGEQFEISKAELIEILPKHKTLNQEVADKLRKIKDNPDKLEDLNDYLDKLKVTENVDIETFDFTEAFNKLSIDIIDKENTIVECSGVFEDNNAYRIIGANFKDIKNIDFILFLDKFNLHAFVYNNDQIEILSNGDIIISESLFVNSVKL